jgi:hypothetical protein
MDIITRQQAKEQGLKTYYDGQPCIRGHNSVRYTKGEQCKQCCLDRSTRRWEQKKDEVKAIMRRYRKRIKSNFPLSTHMSYIRSRALSKGIECTITEADIIIPERCPVLGIVLQRSTRGFQDASPSVDRIDSTKGYVPGNVHVISARANRLKSDATIAELRALVDYFEPLTQTSTHEIVPLLNEE